MSTMATAPGAAGSSNPDSALWRLASRLCPVTGLRVNRDSELLVRWNAVVGIVFLLVGVVAALLLALTRWQAVHLLAPTWFYRILTLHGLNMLIFFIIFFEMAILYFAGPIVLGSPATGAEARLDRRSGSCSSARCWSTSSCSWAGRTCSSPPTCRSRRIRSTTWASSSSRSVRSIATLLFFAALVVAKREKSYTGSMPLVSFGALTAAIIAVITLLHGAAIYIPTFLWSMGYMNVDPEVYRLMFWALGHASQQINVAAMVSVWYLMGGLTIGAVVLNEKVSRWAFVLYVLFISMASAHHLLVDPGFGPAWKVWNTSYAMYLAVLASMIHGFTVPAGMETGMRLRGFVKGRFEWLKKGPLVGPRLLRDLPLAGDLRLHGRHHRRHPGHRADQHPRPQHAAHSRPLPRHRGRRHGALVHGAHLLRDPADLPPQGGVLGRSRSGSRTCSRSAS